MALVIRNSAAKRSKLPAALPSAEESTSNTHLGVEEDGGQIVVLLASRARKVDKVPAVGVVHTRARLSHTRWAGLPTGHSSRGRHHTSTQVHASIRLRWLVRRCLTDLPPSAGSACVCKTAAKTV